MKEKIKNKIDMCLWSFVLIIGVSFMLLGFDIYGRGYSNVNLSRDMLKISYLENLNYSAFSDNYDLNGNTLDYDSFYLLGQQQMRTATYIILIGAFLLGSFIQYFLGEKK